MHRYKTCLLGCGPRGAFHAEGFQANKDRFDLTAVCDLNPARLEAFADRFSIQNRYADAETMLAAERPEVFCFATLPEVRLSLVELGIKYGVKAMAIEKPMAQELSEAREMLRLCDKAGIKLVVSHQQKYGTHWAKVKEIVDAGDIGEVELIRGTARSWLSQLGTHLIDYMIWFNGGVGIEQVLGKAVGVDMLSDSHPSPDYTLGDFRFSNGVRGLLQCGSLAPRNLGDGEFGSQAFWFDNAVTIFGTHGYAQVITGGGWRAFTKSSKGEMLKGDGTFNPSHEQPLYIADLARWLDDPTKVHPCNGAISYHGFEASMALYISSLEDRPVALPLDELPQRPMIDRLREHLPSYHGYAS